MSERQQDLESRLKAIGVILVALFLVLTTRLWYLQVVRGEQFALEADGNRIRPIPIRASRGAIFDREGKPVVSNRPSFTVSIVPLALPATEKPRVLQELARILNITADEIEATLVGGQAFPFEPVRIKRDVDTQTLIALEEQRVYLPGVLVEQEWTREFIYHDLASQTLGYLGRVSDADVSAGYRPTDLIGKTGLEKTYESYLRGEDGQHQVEVNALSRPIRELSTLDPVPGNDLHLTIDLDLQRAAEEAMAVHLAEVRRTGRYGEAGAGAAVVLDPRSGAILALVSQPGYDLSRLHGTERSAYFAELNKDPQKPFLHRALSEYPPGSTFKVVTGLTALEAGSLQIDEVYNATGRGKYGKLDWTLRSSPPLPPAGRITIVGALARSANDFFWDVALRPTTGGVDAIAKMARSFGMGEATGMGLYPGEGTGLVPDKAWKWNAKHEEWYEGETMDVAIGQGYLLTTPLQMAALYMAIANRGTMYRPYLVDKIVGPEGDIVSAATPQVVRHVQIEEKNWEAIIEGLEAVVQWSNGTGAGAFREVDYAPAGKTGSAQIGDGRAAHGWFAAFAPSRAPEIVVVVFAEHGEGGASAAAPVARRILDAYFVADEVEPEEIFDENAISGLDGSI